MPRAVFPCTIRLRRKRTLRFAHGKEPPHSIDCRVTKLRAERLENDGVFNGTMSAGAVTWPTRYRAVIRDSKTNRITFNAGPARRPPPGTHRTDSDDVRFRTRRYCF